MGSNEAGIFSFLALNRASLEATRDGTLELVVVARDEAGIGKFASAAKEAVRTLEALVDMGGADHVARANAFMDLSLILSSVLQTR
jgi:hypothetical protein